MTVRALAAATSVVALAVGVVVALPDDAAPPPPTVAAVAAGHSWTLASAAGPIYVWAPAGYHPDGAAVVVYVHGYYTDVDQAWREHRLAEQFALADVNAVFIAPEAPAGGRQAVRWPALEDLLAEVFGQIDLTRPTGEVIAMGHSGAYRTLLAWLDYPALDWVIHLDATYGEADSWQAWLTASAARHLIMVGDDTVRWCEELAIDLVDALPGQVVTLDRLGFEDDVVPDAALTARVVYVRSQHGHMPLATDGRMIPALLRLAPIERLPDGPWRAPLGLPPLDAGVDGAAP
ncbi:MAG: hypothetical protein R3B06_10065 [Kofleriaceae bacterium]